jgi:S1-C subfamily serine protease
LTPDVGPTPAPAPALLAETTTQLPSIADTVDAVRPAVVGIVARYTTRDFVGNLVNSYSSGTGVIFSPEGMVLTNSHLIIGGPSEVTVTRHDGTQLAAEIVGVDRLSDLGVLRLPEGTYPFLAIEGGSETLRVGDWVIAIGNALALPGDLTVTVGVVSALGRTLDVSEDVTLYDLIQTDAVINPGNSGGPLLNLEGKLVGINSAILRQSSSGGRSNIEGIGFAINTETATLVSSQLVESRRVRWAWMGAYLGDLIPELAAQAGIPVSDGVVIRDVLGRGPAAAAGIQRGDIIQSIAGIKVSTVRDLTRRLSQEFSAGQEVEVELYRNGTTLILPMVLGERPR